MCTGNLRYAAGHSQTAEEMQIVNVRLFCGLRKEKVGGCTGHHGYAARLFQTAKKPQTGKVVLFLWLARADDYPPNPPQRGELKGSRSVYYMFLPPNPPHLPGPGRFTTSKSVCHGICCLQKSPSLYRCTAFSVSGDFFAGIYTRQPFVGRALPGKGSSFPSVTGAGRCTFRIYF